MRLTHCCNIRSLDYYIVKETFLMSAAIIVSVLFYIVFSSKNNMKVDVKMLHVVNKIFNKFSKAFLFFMIFN